MEEKLIIIPGDNFTKRELALRLGAMGIQKPMSQEKYAYVSLYNEAMKAEGNRRKILDNLRADSSSPALSKHIINQSQFWVMPSEKAANANLSVNEMNKRSTKAMIPTIQSQSQLQGEKVNLIRQRLNQFADEAEVNLKEIPKRNIFYNGNEYQSSEVYKPIVKSDLFKKEKEPQMSTNTFKREGESNDLQIANKTNSTIKDNKPNRGPNQYTTRLGNQGIKEEEEEEEITLHSTTMQRENRSKTATDQPQYSRGLNDNEEIIDKDHFNQDIKKNSSFLSKTSFNQYDNVQEEVNPNSSFVNDSLIADNRQRSQGIYAQRNFNNPPRYNNQSNQLKPPLLSQTSQRTNKLKPSDIKSSAPSLGLFTMISIIFILLLSFSLKTEDISHQTFLILPVLLVSVSLGAIIYKLLSYRNQRNMLSEIHQSLRHLVHQRLTEGVAEREIIAVYSAQYNMSPTQFQLEIYPGLAALRKKDKNIRLREGFEEGKLVFYWVWED